MSICAFFILVIHFFYFFLFPIHIKFSLLLIDYLSGSFHCLSLTLLLVLPCILWRHNPHRSHRSQKLGDIITVSPVRNGRRRVLEAYQVHLYTKVLYKQLAGHSAYGVEGVVWVRMCCSCTNMHELRNKL